MISICEVSESKTSLAIAANAKINVDTNFWIKISSLSATLPSLIGDMMMGSWSDIFGKKRMAIMWCFFKIYICFLYIISITEIFIYTRSSTTPLSSVCGWTSCHRYLSQVASFRTIYYPIIKFKKM